jgi:phosphoenolpyruvate carboxylase
LHALAGHAEEEYRALVQDSDLLSTLLEATPYRYLSVLKIGSRPTKRQAGEFSLSSLRAIPWVLCWTQTRSLLPTWWGLGTAWKKMSKEQKEALKAEFKDNPFFSSFVKTLGFSLAKVELNVWKLYFPATADESLFMKMEEEHKSAVAFVQALSGEKKLIWHKPWLEESIRLRSPHIHILNVLQIIAMEREDEPLMKETLVGIACGMLTTG